MFCRIILTFEQENKIISFGFFPAFRKCFVFLNEFIRPNPKLEIEVNFAQLFEPKLELEVVEIVLLSVFAAAFLIQALYYLVFYRKTAPAPKAPAGSEKPLQKPVSVIICAKDEAENLKKFLPSVLEQDYPEFQVIVVNDCSVDETEDVLTRFMQKYDNLYVTAIKQDKHFSHGKKLALTIGIKAARHEWLLLTDADCHAPSKHWLATMQENFTENKQIVLGFGGFARRKGLLNKFIRFDSLFVAMQYLSFAKAGVPYMGVGRNLAYRQSLFFQNKGFASHIKLASGDDDLFVNRVATKHNTAVETRPESFTLSEPKKRWRELITQKRRHFTTGKYYKTKHKILLGAEIISRWLFYIAFFVLVAQQGFLSYALAGFLLRLILQYAVIVKVCKHFQAKDIAFLWFFFDMFALLFNFWIAFTNLFTSRKQKQWK